MTQTVNLSRAPPQLEVPVDKNRKGISWLIKTSRNTKVVRSIDNMNLIGESITQGLGDMASMLGMNRFVNNNIAKNTNFGFERFYPSV